MGSSQNDCLFDSKGRGLEKSGPRPLRLLNCDAVCDNQSRIAATGISRIERYLGDILSSGSACECIGRSVDGSIRRQ